LAQIFPKWSNRLPAVSAAAAAVLVVVLIAFIYYYGSPAYTDTGYRPLQPVPYSHKLHAGDLGIDCRYCHTRVEVSWYANVPPTQTCINCHKLILTESERLLPVRESLSLNRPLEWVRVHNLGDYCYFNHSAHLHAGVGCTGCHGRVDQMKVVAQSQPLSMGWCLDCHRGPDNYLRPHADITNMSWNPPENQAEMAAQIIAEKNLDPPRDCSGCHR